MKIVQQQLVADIEDIYWPLTGRWVLGISLVCLMVFFIAAGFLLQAIDPTAGVLDIGILSVLFWFFANFDALIQFVKGRPFF